MRGYHTLDDIKVDAQRVLVRADLNIPLDNGEVGDVTRLERLLPTIRELIGKTRASFCCLISAGRKVNRSQHCHSSLLPGNSPNFLIRTSPSPITVLET